MSTEALLQIGNLCASAQENTFEINSNYSTWWTNDVSLSGNTVGGINKNVTKTYYSIFGKRPGASAYTKLIPNKSERNEITAVTTKGFAKVTNNGSSDSYTITINCIPSVYYKPNSQTAGTITPVSSSQTPVSVTVNSKEQELTKTFTLASPIRNEPGYYIGLSGSISSNNIPASILGVSVTRTLQLRSFAIWYITYTPGCYIDFYNYGESFADSGSSHRTRTSNAPVKLPLPIRTGYRFTGWYLNSQHTGTKYMDDYNFPTNDEDIKFYADWKKLYSVSYYDNNTLLKNDQYSVGEEENYTILSASGDDIQENGVQSLYKNKQFLGWSTDSTATTPTYTSNDTISNVIANITLYAVWQERDSITIEQVLPNSQVTEPATITVTGAAASDDNTYYFNSSSNISFSIAIKQEHEIYFIDSVAANTTTDLITNGSLTADRKTYTSGQITTGTNATAITITIVYIEGLPIFYPSGENDFKRAMYTYWENTRAIGLYYENTRLL